MIGREQQKVGVPCRGEELGGENQSTSIARSRVSKTSLENSPNSEMSNLIHSFDWSATPLGPRSAWSLALRGIVRFILANRSPMLLCWGREGICVYNDAFRSVLGTKHPRALGRPSCEVWQDNWEILRSLVETPFYGDQTTTTNDLMLAVDCRGFVAEKYYSATFCSVPDETASRNVGGVLATFQDSTVRIVNERRLRLLRDLASRAASGKNADEVCMFGAETLEKYSKDIPFALLYLLAADHKNAHLVATSGVRGIDGICPQTLPIERNGVTHLLWPLTEVLQSKKMQILPELDVRFGAAVPEGPWSEPPNTAAVIPIDSNKAGRVAGFLVAGLSSRLPFDSSYRDLLNIVAAQIALSIENHCDNELHPLKEASVVDGLLQGIEGGGDDFAARELLARISVNVEMVRQRRETERTLQKSEKRFRALVEASSDVVYRMSPDWTEMRQLIGREFIANTEEPTKTWLQRYIHPDDQAHVTSAIHEAIRNRSIFELEHRVLRVDGRLGWTFSRAIPILDEHGEITEWFGTATDVTESHHTREKLRYQVELIDLAHDTIFARDELDCISYWSKGSELLYGWSEQEALGQPAHVLLQTKFPEPLEKIRETLFRTDRWSGELVHTCRNGRTITVDSRWAVQRDDAGKCFRVVEINNDITERKRAEDEGQRFISLAEHSVEFIGMCDVEFKPFYVNNAAMRLVGLDSMEQACATNVHEFFFSEDHDFLDNDFFPRVVRDGSAEIEIRFRHFKTGEAIWMVYAVFKLHGRDGAHVGYATVSRDITSHKQAEQALRDADRHKDEFLATLAHELRNPLAPICTALELLKKAGDDPRLRTKICGTLERQTDQLVTLVNDLLDVSRISKGKLELRTSRVILSDIIRSAVESSQPLIQKEKHQLHVDIPNEQLVLDGDPHRLAQVISNLLNNAARYTPREGTIWLTAQKQDHELLLSVRDNGIGIRPEMRDRIFDMFTQADHHQQRPNAGLGIGLTLTKSLVEMHGGHIEVHSEGVNQGSEFQIRLPMAI